jgi:hypothetical protein
MEGGETVESMNVGSQAQMADLEHIFMSTCGYAAFPIIVTNLSFLSIF